MKWSLLICLFLTCCLIETGCGGYFSDPFHNFTLEHNGQIVKTPVGILTGKFYSNITLAFGEPTLGNKLPENQIRETTIVSVKAYTHFVYGLKPGENQVTIYIHRPSGPVEQRIAKIIYNPDLDLRNRKLLCVSHDNFSVIYDAVNGLPVAILPNVSNLITWDDPTKAIGFDSNSGQMVEYNIYQLQKIRDLGAQLRPRKFLKNGQVLLCKDGTLYNFTTHQIDSFHTPYSAAISNNCKYAAWIERWSPLTIKNLVTGQTVEIRCPEVYDYLAGLGISDNGEVIISSYAWATGHLTFVDQNRVLTEISGLQDYMGEVIFHGEHAYIGADGNPRFGHPVIYRFNLTQGKIDRSFDGLGGSCLRLTPPGNLIAAKVSILSRATSFFPPNLSRLGKEVVLPNPTVSDAESYSHNGLISYNISSAGF